MPMLHADARTYAPLLVGIKTFAELENRIGQLPNSLAVGGAWEVFVEAWLRSQRAELFASLHPQDTGASPDQIRQMGLKFARGGQSVGHDGIMVGPGGEKIVYEAKFTTPNKLRKKVVSWRRLGSFFMQSSSSGIAHRYVFTNADSLPMKELRHCLPHTLVTAKDFAALTEQQLAQIAQAAADIAPDNQAERSHIRDEIHILRPSIPQSQLRLPHLPPLIAEHQPASDKAGMHHPATPKYAPLLAGNKSFAELEDKIERLPTKHQKGAAWEVFIEAWIGVQWADRLTSLHAHGLGAPEGLEQHLGLARTAAGETIGHDGVMIGRGWEKFVYEAKFLRRKRRHAMTIASVSSFFGQTSSRHITHRYIFTNAVSPPLRGIDNCLPSTVISGVQFATLTAEQLAEIANYASVYHPIDRAPTAEWLDGIARLDRAAAKCGRPNPPQHSPDWEVHQAGIWTARQRAKREAGILTKTEIAILEDRGIVWDPHWAHNDECIFVLEGVYSRHGHCDLTQKFVRGNRSLQRAMTWLVNRRAAKKTGRLDLTEAHLARCAAIKVDWTPEDKIAARHAGRLTELAIFRKQNGHCNVPDNPRQAKCKGAVILATWLVNRRRDRAAGRMDPALEKAMTELGVDWAPLETHERKMRAELLKFKAQHGHCDVPENDKNHPELSAWLVSARYVRNKAERTKRGGLEPDKLKFMTEAGVDWNPVQNEFKANLAALSAYRDKHGHANVPQLPNDPDIETRRLARLASRWRSGFKAGKFTDEQIKQIKETGLDLEMRGTVFARALARLDALIAIQGHCNTLSVKLDKGAVVRNAVSGWRAAFAAGKLPPEQIAKLQARGLRLSTRTKTMSEQANPPIAKAA